MILVSAKLRQGSEKRRLFMKKVQLLFIFNILSLYGYSQIYSFDRMTNSDTLIINYSISSGELGIVNNGIIITKKDNKLIAIQVVYNIGVSILPNGLIKVENDNLFIPQLNIDSIKAFYRSIKDNYTILKGPSVLNNKQIECLQLFIKEVKNFKSKGISNAPDFYAIIKKNKELVIVDQSGEWDKYRDIQKILKN